MFVCLSTFPLQLRQGKASGGSSSTNSLEGEKWKEADEEKKGKCKKEENGEWNKHQEEQDYWHLPNEENAKWYSAEKLRRMCNLPEESRQRCDSSKEQKQKRNLPNEHNRNQNSAEEHKQNSPEEQEWDSLVQHMDRKTISLKVWEPPKPEKKKGKKLRRDVKR